MSLLWVLVSEAARARIFEIRNEDPVWHPVEHLQGDSARIKTSDLPGDRAHFEPELIKLLDQAIRANRFDHWILVAPPNLLETLRPALTPMLRKQLLAVVDQDLHELSAVELGSRLADIAQIPADRRKTVREPKPRI